LALVVDLVFLYFKKSHMRITKQLYIVGLVALGLVIFSCQKMERPKLGDYTKDANPPGGPLKFYAAFDGTTADPRMNAVDSIRANFPADNPLASVPGVSGQAIKGANGKAIKYPSPNDFATSTSFTIAFWMKNTPRAAGDGPEFLFSVPSKEYWHNSGLFMLIEDGSLSSTSAAQISFVVQDNWFIFDGANKMKNIINGNWHHLVFTYDETTSKLAYYIDGLPIQGLPASLTDFKDGGNPKGKLIFKQVQSLVIGGWNKHVSGIDGPTDAWINSYTGTMDQFRLYGKALTASEVLALYNSKL
jgi:hypothetical protein